MNAEVNLMVSALTERRKDLGYSQRELDRLIGLSDCMIAKWESGARFPTASSLVRWAAALGYELAVKPTGKRKKKP